jgi:predicted O-linked N-acetylglucosamine transferase (SPINDLY family)
MVEPRTTLTLSQALTLAARHYQTGQLQEAEKIYRQMLQLHPEEVETYNSLGNLLTVQGQFEEAENCYRQVLLRKPDFTVAHCNLGSVLATQGKIEEASWHFQEVLRVNPNLGSIRIKLALLWPVIMGLPQDLWKSRLRMENTLTELLRSDITLQDPVNEVGITNFFSAYHGLNDKDIQVKLATFYQRACPALLYNAPHCQNSARKVGTHKIKLGLVSRFFRNHTISKIMKGLIANLSRQQFQVHVFFLSPPEDDVSQFIQHYADSFETLPLVLKEAHTRIAAQQLDILCYPDIGMEPFTYFLAFARLAPVQCVTWGHPVTTGIPNIDYFVSSRYYELAENQRYYSEKLVCLNSLLAYYYRPTFPIPLKSRQTFGLAEEHHIYLCPQSLFKFHPVFDTLLGQILRQDPQGRVVLVEESHHHWNELLKQRFQQTLPDVQERIQWLPRQSFSDYLNLLAIADVMLDTLHFGGGSTTYEALAIGLPIVTYPSSYLRGRFAYGCYQRMGVMDCVADSLEHYVKIAVRLGTDPDYRAHIKTTILAANQVLYENREVIQEFERFLVAA